MRNAPNLKAEKYRLHHVANSSECAGTNNGAFIVGNLAVIASDGGGWDHVSVHVVGVARCPTWEEMCLMKDLFFRDDEWVMQLHPPKKDNISCHPYTLHLWRPHTQEEWSGQDAESGGVLCVKWNVVSRSDTDSVADYGRASGGGVMSASKYVHVMVDAILKETEKAFLCQIGDDEHWIPFSQIADYEDYCVGDDDVEISITEWIAKEKGLL